MNNPPRPLKPALKAARDGLGGLSGDRARDVFFSSVVQVRELGASGREDFDFGEGDYDYGAEDEGREHGGFDPNPGKLNGLGITNLDYSTYANYESSNTNNSVPTIDSWYLDDAGRIASSDPSLSNAQTAVPVRTSPLKGANGLFVYTSSGSVYRLGQMDARVSQIFARIYPSENFDPDAPLSDPNARRALRYAARIVHGEAGETWRGVCEGLKALEGQLGAPEIVAPEMDKIWAILAGMGLDR